MLPILERQLKSDKLDPANCVSPRCELGAAVLRRFANYLGRARNRAACFRNSVPVAY
jgi:hypothetical protein